VAHPASAIEVEMSAAIAKLGDERARLIEDPDHSGAEERFILLGLSNLRMQI
jgi:hypothetical protein